MNQLSQRERQVLCATTSGKTIKTIAAELGISYSTADKYRQQAYKKLNVNCIANAMRAAIKMGIVEL